MVKNQPKTASKEKTDKDEDKDEDEENYFSEMKIGSFRDKFR